MFNTTLLIAAIPLLSDTLTRSLCSTPVFITWVGISLEYDANLPPNPSVGVPPCVEEKPISSTVGDVTSNESPPVFLNASVVADASFDSTNGHPSSP